MQADPPTVTSGPASRRARPKGADEEVELVFRPTSGAADIV